MTGPLRGGPLRARLGSGNAAKREALRLGLASHFAPLQIDCAEVASGVDEQPLGWAEIVRGARNRARASFDPGNCDLAAGIEDGLIEVSEVPSGWLNVGCCALFDGEREGLGFTAGFEYPPACSHEATRSPRTPIGDVFERRFTPPADWPAPHPGDGNIGRLTAGALTRAAYGAQAVQAALLRFLHPGDYAHEAPR